MKPDSHLIVPEDQTSPDADDKAPPPLVLELVRAGFTVIPGVGKVPIVEWAPWQPVDAIPDEAQVRRWARGIDTKYGSVPTSWAVMPKQLPDGRRFWLADLDAKKGLDVVATLADWSVLAHERTVSHGAHVYVCSERDGETAKARDVVFGVDVNGYRADGSGKSLSWIVAPGYQNLISPADMLVPESAMPVDLVERVHAPREPGASTRERGGDPGARGCIPATLVDAAYSVEPFDADAMLAEYGEGSRSDVGWALAVHAVANGSKPISDEEIETFAGGANDARPKDHRYTEAEAMASRRQAERYRDPASVSAFIRARARARRRPALERRVLDAVIVLAHRFKRTEGLYNLPALVARMLGCSERSVYRALAGLESVDSLLVVEEAVWRGTGADRNRSRVYEIGPRMTAGQIVGRDRLRRRRGALPFSRTRHRGIREFMWARADEQGSLCTQNKRMPRVTTSPASAPERDGDLLNDRRVQHASRAGPGPPLPDRVHLDVDRRPTPAAPTMSRARRRST